MTARQIRAYLRSAERLEAAEHLEEAIVAMVSNTGGEAALQQLDRWRFAIDPTPREEVRDGQLVRTIGQWKMLSADQTRALIGASGPKPQPGQEPSKE